MKSFNRLLGTSPSEISESVLAFSTIATMLSNIKRTRAFNDLTSTGTMMMQLKLLDALATVLAKDEDVAVAFKLDSEPSLFEAIACVEAGRLEPQVAPIGFGQQILTWLDSNIRTREDKSMTAKTNFPQITSPEPPSDLNNISQIENYIQSEKRSWTFQDHVAITSKLLTAVLSDMKNGSRLFEQYIVAACCKKMLSRLTHPLSMPFKVSLNKLSSDFPKPTQIAYDANDLNHDKAFLSLLSAIQSDISKPTPNLLKVAEASNNEPFELYTEETQSEFHTLICDLLEKYEGSLEALTKYSPDTTSSFIVTLLRAVGFGNALHHLIKTTAIKKHLKAIELHLDNFRADADELELKETDMEGDMPDNPDILSVQPSAVHDGNVMPPWESYLNWLKLMVGHVDAIWVVTAYITDRKFQYTGINIKMLIPPRSKQTMLPWEKLLTSGHFPRAAPPGSMEKNLPPKSTEEIISFLKGASGKGHVCSNNNHCPLFRELQARPLRVGSSSSGTCHCELCLASLISLSQMEDPPEGYESVLEVLRNASRFIGVSKRCCPLCAYMLTALPGGPFYFSGSHSTISACVLPKWLPETFVKNMNHAWGGELRARLIEMMCAP